MLIMLSFPVQECKMPFHLFRSTSVSLQCLLYRFYRFLAKFNPTAETFVDESTVDS